MSVSSQPFVAPPSAHPLDALTVAQGSFGVSASARRAMARLTALVVVVDAVVLLGATWMASIARLHLHLWIDDPRVLEHVFVSDGLWICALWMTWLVMRGSYSRKVFASGADELKRIVTASLLTAGTVGMACYLTKFDLSRGFVFLAFLIGTPLLVAERYAARRWLHSARRRGRMSSRVILVGGRSAIGDVSEILTREAAVGYAVVGCCPTDGTAPTSSQLPDEVGASEDIRALAVEHDVDAVMLVGGALSDAADVRRIAWALEGTRVDLIVAPSLTDIAGPRVHIRPVAGLPLLHVEQPQAAAAVRWGKRTFDLVLAGLVTLLAAPVFLVAAVAIKVHDGGPVFFRQQRIGLRGREFWCLKFRTMCPDADAQYEEMLDSSDTGALLFKLHADHRVTGIGRFLRRYSLDELPQLVNVLRGDMSLVGPRPQVPREVAEYADTMHRRLLVRPGLTGLWQVSGRSTLSVKDSMRLDLYYVDNWSMFEDLVILVKTVRAVLTGHGAY